METQETNSYLNATWWTKTLSDFGFGNGVWEHLIDDSDPNQVIAPELKLAVDECYETHHSAKKVRRLKNYLDSVVTLHRQDLRFLWASSVEQKGLLRVNSDAMLREVGELLSRT